VNLPNQAVELPFSWNFSLSQYNTKPPREKEMDIEVTEHPQLNGNKAKYLPVSYYATAPRTQKFMFLDFFYDYI